LGNDSILLLERAIQDLGAGVKWLRAKGFDRIVLIGNSGGGALVSLYQSQAESLTIDRTVDGDPIELTPQDLPPAEAIVLNAAHLGRSLLMQKWIDPAVIDEHEPSLSDPSLDMFDEGNGPPYSRAFLERFRTQQIDRLNRIDAWVTERLTTLRSVQCGYRDQAFVIHRTLADPRCLDPGIDSNDRTPRTTVWGPPRAQNYSANSMGRFTTLTGFSSQWSPRSRGNGPVNLACTSVRVLLAEHTADASVFPTDITAWRSAAGKRAQLVQLLGGTHYLSGQQHLIEQLSDEIASFSRSL
jgi:pimeloyl-ACP methyl ester carboxylesterase